MEALTRRAGRRRAVRGACGVLVFLAVLPAVLPYDHLLMPRHDDSTQTSSAHQMHCHDTPGSCSDQPMTSGPGEFLFAGPLIVVPSLFATPLAMVAPHAPSFSERPTTPPPQV
jgi:hypothetical protein